MAQGMENIMSGRILTIINTKSQLTEIRLDDYGKDQLQLGRNEEQCDIVIQDKVVSRVHGTILLQGGRIYYMDMDSSNGTFMGNAGQNRLLKAANGYVEIFDKSILRIGSVNEPDKMVLLLFHIMPEGEVWRQKPLGSEMISIGRAPENEISLKHPGVSTVHCQIQREGGNYILFDNHSTNGTMVNGQNITSPIILKDKDVIQILDYQLLFSNACIYYKANVQGISLRVSNVSKFVGLGKKRKQILNNVNCEIQANEFVAIIGGSGAGKTTLMTAISGFDPDFEGHIYCNGIDLIEQFNNLKSIIGFVPQQDIIYENLTLHRMLYYTAKMKMPPDTGKEEIQQRIEEVLRMVELQDHQATYIRKLSGGQKKRASIAVELLADPKLFFLDEPTSGLDPGTEQNLMKTLSTLAKEQNKTVIMVTHTTQNLHLCDKVIFMGPGGRLCFCGNVAAAKSFYETDDLVNIYNMIASNPKGWSEHFARHSKVNTNPQAGAGKAVLQKPRREPAIRQFLILTQRYAELMKNDTPRLLVLLMQPLLIALLLKVVADENIFTILETTKSMMFALSCSGIWIGLFNSIQEICKERVIVKREYMANLKLPGYIMSKLVLQALLGFAQAAILTYVFLGLIGEERNGIFTDNFSPEILLTVWLAIMASVAMGFIISALVQTGDKAMAVAPFVLIVQLLFSGILFPLDGGVGEYISYCTMSRWSVEALGSITTLNDLEPRMQEELREQLQMPEFELERDAEDFFESTKEHVMKDWLILMGMTALFVVVSTISLRSVAKDRR